MLKFLVIASSKSFTTVNLRKVIESRGHICVVGGAKDIVIGGDKVMIGANDLASFDIVLFRGYNNLHGEILLAAQYLRRHGVVFTDESLADAWYRNKLYQAIVFAQNNIPHPEVFKTRSVEQWSKFLAQTQFPLVVKSLCPELAARGLGVQKLNSFEEAERFFSDEDKRNDYFAQKYYAIECDYRVFVVGDKVVGVIKRDLSADGFLTNVSQGGLAQAVLKPTKRMSDLAIKAARAVRAEITGVDIIESGDELLVLEVNFGPQWEGLMRATDINVGQKVVDYVLKKYEEKNRIS